MIGIKMAYYRKADWPRFLSIISDKESMHDTWKEWHKAYEKLKKNLRNKGFIVVDVTVDLDELIEYCLKRKIENDGKARSQFVQNKRL